LEDVYDRTKISLGNLRAIEEGRIDDLPHPVYAKGFVKNYAHMLGMDADEMAQEFTRNFTQADFIGEEHVPEVQEDIQPPEPEEKDRKWTFVSVFLTVVLLAVLGWLVYDVFLVPQTQMAEQSTERQAAVNETSPQQARQAEPDEPAAAAEESEQQSRKQQEEQATSELPLPPGNATQGVLEEAASGTGGGNASTAASNLEANETIAWEEVQNGTQDRQASAEETEPASQAEETEAASEASQEAAQPPSTHVLEVSATEACWLRAEVDDKERDMYLRPGESVTFRFKESLVLKLGNAGGVELLYDGEPHELEAKSGEVKTVRFP
jgi:cytoskeleton protein RodZ